MLLQTAVVSPYAAAAVENAVRKVLRDGYRTGDIASSLAAPKLVGCKEMGRLVAAAIMN